jgi:hypothetical protein
VLQRSTLNPGMFIGRGNHKYELYLRLLVWKYCLHIGPDCNKKKEKNDALLLFFFVFFFTIFLKFIFFIHLCNGYIKRELITI